VFSAIAAHTSMYMDTIVGVVNELPSADEALDLLPLLPRAIDGVKTDILTIMKAH
jgi:hypothetical protein